MPGTAYIEKRVKNLIWKNQVFFIPSNSQTVYTMKIISILALLALLSFRPFESGNATVRKITGVEIYVYSEPSNAYEVIDSGKVLMTLTGGCDEVINQAAKKALKAGANGVIIDLQSSKWTAIKF